jgi:hypothetical protein
MIDPGIHLEICLVQCVSPKESNQSFSLIYILIGNGNES